MADRNLWTHGLPARVDGAPSLILSFAILVTPPPLTRPGSRAAGFPPKPAATVSQRDVGDDNGAPVLPPLETSGVAKDQ